MKGNWIDFIIIGIAVFQGYQGWQAGLLYLGTSLISLIVAVGISMAANQPVAAFITDKFGITAAWSSVISYIIVVIIADGVFNELFHSIVSRLPANMAKSKVNSWLGSFLHALNGVIMVSFFLLIILALPIRGTIKKDIQNSQIGGFIIKVTDRYGLPLKKTLEDVEKAAVQFVTILPSSKETLKLDVAPLASDLFVDAVWEKQMVDLVNSERQKAGVALLTVNSTITNVARNHSRDMFLRRYFSHISPDGLTPADRISKAKLQYTILGENLAYAPSVTVAHEGLMNSPEHKKNILDPQFHKIGIGVVATDRFGAMFTQDFTD